MLTKVRLLLKEQSDQGLHCFPFCLHLIGTLLSGKPHCSKFLIITAFFGGARFIISVYLLTGQGKHYDSVYQINSKTAHLPQRCRTTTPPRDGWSSYNRISSPQGCLTPGVCPCYSSESNTDGHCESAVKSAIKKVYRTVVENQLLQE